MEAMEAAIASHLHVSTEIVRNVGISLLLLVSLFLLKEILISVIAKKTENPQTVYFAKRMIGYGYGILLIILLAGVWIKGFGSIGTYIGIVSAGLAIALHETLANIAAWLFIIWKKPFSIGDRIQIGDTKGDVIDIRMFQFSLVEVGNWVNAEQSTGRVMHIPNNMVVKEKLANYHAGFTHIWNEIGVLITFESDWRKAKKILETIAKEKVGYVAAEAEQEIHRAASEYMIYFRKLTPAVYLSTKDSGIMLSIRYVILPRKRRGSEQEIWEAILTEFEKHPDIDLAYPTTRFLTQQIPENHS